MAPVLLCVLVWTAFAWSPTRAHLNETIYAVTVSSRVTGGASETLCAHVLSPPEPLALRVTLEAQSGSTVILEETVSTDYYGCSTFQVPIVTSSTVATVNVTIQGESAVMSKETKVLIAPPAFLHLIVTDKPLYKPGQTVQFRIVSMDAGFIPFNELYKTVELQDPNRNRIAQWLDRAAVSGILDLSHPMSPEAAQGPYTITAWTEKGESTSRSFDIKEYVLPKYAVNIRLPNVINILHQEVPIQICGRYTYGKPVLGSIKVVVCREGQGHFRGHYFRPEDICVTSQLQTDRTGCATHFIRVSALGPRDQTYRDMFEVTAEMEEYGTGVVIQASGQTPFSVNVRELTFENVADNTAYKPGIPFEGKVKLTGIDRKAVGDEVVYLYVDVNAASYNLTLLTQDNGMASFSLDTSLWKNSVVLTASSRPKEERQSFVHEERLPAYPSAVLTMRPFYSKSKSFVKISANGYKSLCEGESQVGAQYIIQGEELRPGQEELPFYYTVMSKGAIMRHGHLPVAVKEGIVNKGVLSIPLLGKAALSPYAQVVVYTLMPSGEVLADNKNFPVDQCFENRVKLEFSADRELPGGETSFRLEGQPGSLCSVRAVDQSVLLLQPDQELSASYVFNKLPVQKLSGFSYQVEDREPDPCSQSGQEMVSTEKDDVYKVFKEIGIKLVTNSEVKKPAACLYPEYQHFPMNYDGFEFYYGVVQESDSSMHLKPMKKKREKIETVRSYFPDTWIWELIAVGDSGSVSVVKTLPDTITSWRAQAFCTSSSLGFGLSRDTALVAFQPFFVSLTLPYSVVRGEVFTLRATVFNYLPSCIMVRVQLSNSSHFSLRECADCQYTMCVCAEESRVFQWEVSPSSLGEVTLEVRAEALHTEQLCGNEVAPPPTVGRVDTVVRKLLVEAEGTPVAVTHNVLLCPGEKPAEKNISLLLPDLFVACSARASFSVFGDLMGRAMKNLDKLLAMPYGCGEQNMILFAPNIYILNYLTSTAQLTHAIKERATRFLESGYQRELTYRHDDGSYSAFGKSDASGNTWLTAFVMKSFGGAKPYIFIDPKLIVDSRTWLLSHRRQDGCITSVGKLFHNGMKGGVSDDVSLTAYITAALLELDAADPMVSGCLQCLRVAVAGKLENMYTTALLSYTFTLAGDQQTRAALLTALHQRSVTDGGTRHWKRAEASEKVLDSLEVEMTAYVLLAVLSGPPVPGFDLDYASSITRWLIQQQNPYGGFASTQDTVVALQALARYGAATYSSEGASVVGLSSLGGASWQFTVDQSTRLLYQEQALDRLPGDYRITAQGQGCVQTQIAMRYNIPPPGDFSSFHIVATTTAVCNSTRPTLTIRVDLRYQGRREETNMVIINLKLLSGYGLQQSTLQELKRESSVKRVDFEEGYINIYLDGLKKEVLRSYSVTLEEEEAVRNLRPAVVKVYDYYQTSDEAVADYSSPCAERDDVNDLLLERSEPPTRSTSIKLKPD
ncbi:alpha-2-macroglobulin-like protein 1 isoform X2 [Gadus chalcogrammus]|uniref:alpha-2-macroglobulin-like protein 1 isoform X2 n=1 Tax=Gadus chalcogrammus TaxID=1042646 RepID=UPI0024C4E476|nr:alpha-2-macroglobulin-like protein 1 isoform X2 [Gadus chalcogrammus]